MSWASHPTTEMATTSPIGRHRRRASRLLVVIAGGLLVAAVLAAMLLPLLLGRPPSDDPQVAPSTVASTAPTSAESSPTPTPTPTATPSAATTTASAGGGSGGGGGSEADATLAALEDRVLTMTNAERVKKDGCGPLRMDDKLRTVARAHSADMVNSGYFNHNSLDGRDPGRRMRDAGYNTDRGWAENIARGYPTVEAVMAGWMDSDGHLANILNCSMRSLGVGVARTGNGRLYWTQDFGGR